MLPAWHLAVAVVVRLPSRVGKSLHFVAFGVLDKAKVRVRIAPRLIEVDAQGSQPTTEPVLKVEFLVAPALSLNQLTVDNCLNTQPEERRCLRHYSALAVVLDGLVNGGRPVELIDETFDVAKPRVEGRQRRTRVAEG